MCFFKLFDKAEEHLSENILFVDSHVFTDVALTVSGFACPATPLLETTLTPRLHRRGTPAKFRLKSTRYSTGVNPPSLLRKLLRSLY